MRAGAAMLLLGATVSLCSPWVSACHTRGHGAGGAVGTAVAGCAGSACTAACPRDASVDASGRCACTDGTLPVLGACLRPDVADAYCFPPARFTAAGECSMPVCASVEAVDLETGCLPLSALARGGARACATGSSLVVDDRHVACVPADAACPHGTHALGDHDHACGPALRCPPGSLPHAGACVSLVTYATRAARGTTRVDVGLWAALVLGIDHGDGADALCQPLAARPVAFGLAAGDKLDIGVRVALTFPDQDLSAVHASVETTAAPGHLLIPGAVTLVRRAVDALVEPLRGLGGEASAAEVDLQVRCQVVSL
jgi:hypothetical protein